MKAPHLFRDKVYLPLLKLLKQGLTPSKLALVMAIGTTVSVFPILGFSTLVCTLLAILFRLNLPAIQIANYVAFPIQVGLFFPFLKIGEKLTGVAQETPSKTSLASIFDNGLANASHEIFSYLTLASYGWILTAIPLFVIFYYAFWAIFKRYKKLLALHKI